MVRKAILSACVVAVAAFGSASFAEDKAPTTSPAMGNLTPEQQAQMQEWESFAKPGPQHEEFAKMVGKWTVEMEDYSAGDQPMKFQGESTFEMILGGRYLAHNYKGSMMGMQFEGYGLSAYDNLKKKYVDIWLDNMGTGIYVSEGEENDQGEIVYTGKMTMPGAGEITMKQVAKKIDDDTHSFAMYTLLPGGGEKKVMAMTYKRKK
jgi:hypothetical protein